MQRQVFTFFAFICCLCFYNQLRANEISYQQFQFDVRKNLELKTHLTHTGSLMDYLKTVDKLNHVKWVG